MLAEMRNDLGANGGGAADENELSESRGVLLCLQDETGESTLAMV